MIPRAGAARVRNFGRFPYHDNVRAGKPALHACERMIGQEITARHGQRSMTAALLGATVMVWTPVSGGLLRLPVTKPGQKSFR
jgi:hypothetical protein